jgi:GTP-binding protein YchF
MKIGILGLPQAGKTTLFQALTRGQAQATSSRGEKVHLGSVQVPDRRLDHLGAMYQPKKFTPAKVDYVDAPALETTGRERGALAALTALRDVDAYALVVRAFPDPSVAHVMETVDPERDAGWLLGELLLEDLALVERRLERIEKAVKVGKKPEDPNEYEALKLAKGALESEKPVSAAGLSVPQERSIRGFQLFSQRPWIFVVNASDDQMTSGEAGVTGPVSRRFPSLRAIGLSAKTEAELAALSEAEAREFMSVLGIEEPGLTKMIRICFEALGLLSFFTVGQDEVRAWTVRDGSTAPQAAGAIHSDLERGFIRAEVIGYDELARAQTMAKAREQGLLRTEGRDYRVRDGDILNIRFSV